MTERSNDSYGRSLEQMQRARTRMATTVPASRTGEQRYMSMLGLALGVLAGAIVLTTHRSPAGLILSLSGFVIALQFALLHRQDTHTVSGPGSRRRFALVGALTAVLYAAVVAAAAFRTQPFPWWVAVAGALVVAAPAVVAAVLQPRRS